MPPVFCLGELSLTLAKDFTEVDNNVTRNIAPELENNDWGLMVLHYLGLDHIGHKAGPKRFVPIKWLVLFTN